MEIKIGFAGPGREEGDRGGGAEETGREDEIYRSLACQVHSGAFAFWGDILLHTFTYE